MDKLNLVSAKIKKLRTNLNMSQDRFGKKFGISGKTISAYERGKCVPPLRVLEKISEAYNTGFVGISPLGKTEIIDKIHVVKQFLLDLENKLLD